MPVEYVSLLLLLDRPDSNGSVGTPTDEDISFVLKSPDSSFVAVESASELTVLDVVDVDGVLREEPKKERRQREFERNRDATRERRNETHIVAG